jgi:hypothetical protein
MEAAKLKGGQEMSYDEAEALRESLEEKWNSERKRNFISRMEHKLNHRERKDRYIRL